MKKELHILGITIVLIAVGFSGCTDTNNSGTNTSNDGTNNTNNETNTTNDGAHNSFVGKWESLSFTEGNMFYHTITFYSDGQVNLLHKNSSISDNGLTNTGTWYKNETTVSFNITGYSLIRNLQYTFTNSETLILYYHYGINTTGKITYKKVPETK